MDMYNKVVLDDLDHRVVISSSVTIYLSISSVGNETRLGTLVMSKRFHIFDEQITDSKDVKCLLHGFKNLYLTTIYYYNYQDRSEIREFIEESEEKMDSRRRKVLKKKVDSRRRNILKQHNYYDYKIYYSATSNDCCLCCTNLHTD